MVDGYAHSLVIPEIKGGAKRSHFIPGRTEPLPHHMADKLSIKTQHDYLRIPKKLEHDKKTKANLPTIINPNTRRKKPKHYTFVSPK
ncbi:hypothetical protein RJT34_14284 [Clitoria ternatea]|uniref:Uncharacterized protein n=1 Tax=Clitoria ternatea TaxID=43366 RepID=A0AAN9PKZ0_CLITE